MAPFFINEVQMTHSVVVMRYNKKMNTNTLGFAFLKELESEAPASRKCLERIPPSLFDYKPHEKSMPMGYLSLLVAEVPLWMATMVEQPQIDFASFKHIQPKTTAELVAHFDENMAKARKVLAGTMDKVLEEPFSIASHGKVLMTTTKKDMIGPAINHWVHHRGQLTVYMRLNNIPVPAIYGPSADDKGGF